MVFLGIIGALTSLSRARTYERSGLGWKNTRWAGFSLGIMKIVLLSLRFEEVLRWYPRYQLKV